MLNPNLPEPDLLKTVLEPLLEDFQYWFSRSTDLLQSQEIPFLSTHEQAELLAAVSQAQQEVIAVQALMKATNAEAGVDTSVLMTWHQLVMRCWQVSLKLRTDRA
jgi:hypothetical protein